MESLRNRTVLVTGASRGLGLEIAQQFAGAGAHVALLARDATTLADAQEQVVAAQVGAAQQVRVYAADLANEAQIDHAVHACLADFGTVDILVNNAAIQGPIGPFEQVDWAAWRAVFEVNLFAPARLCRLVIPAMRARGSGKIINLSGGGATSPRPDLSAYATTKCGLVRFSETLAEELRSDRIDVNCVAPGAMNTRMLDELLASGPDGARREYAQAVKRAQQGGTAPAQAAALVVWLASPISDGISGRLFSAVWDDWASLPERWHQMVSSDVYTLRRIVPQDRGMQ